MGKTGQDELISTGDRVDLLAEKSKLNKNEFITGKQFYIWGLIDQGEIIIGYEDVSKMVHDRESVMLKYVNSGWLAVLSFWSLYIYTRFLKKQQDD